MLDVSLILDIGKTNKKLLLFNNQCQIVEESQIIMQEIKTPRISGLHLYAERYLARLAGDM